MKRILPIVVFSIFFVALASAAPGNFNSCIDLNESGVWNLTGTISGISGNCLNVTIDNVEIQGNGFSIVGNGTGYGIDASNSTIGANAFNNLTIFNLNISNFSTSINGLGTIGEPGGITNNNGGNGGRGASITIFNSFLENIITSPGNGGSGGSGGADTVGGTAGESGTIILMNTTAQNIVTTGGNGGDGFGAAGFGGNGTTAGLVTITNSNVSIITANGGRSGNGGKSGNGGIVTITNSTTSNISSNGELGMDGNLDGGDAGNGGNILISNSVTGTISSTGNTGGTGYNGGVDGTTGNGGVITIERAITSTITTNGGNSGNTGGNAGSVTVNDSIVGAVNAIPGSGAVGAGVAGIVILTNSSAGNINTYGMTIGGSGASVTLISSSAGIIDTHGDSGLGLCNGGVGGAVTLTNSNSSNIITSGGEGDSTSCNAGKGGAVTLTNSIASNITSIGGISDINDGGDGGLITLTSSTVWNIITNGGQGSDGNVKGGGYGGNITMTNSYARAITSNGGDNPYYPGFGPAGGNGGFITLTNSNVTSINSKAGYGYFPGVGGFITLTNSNATSINSTGGDSVDVNKGGIGGNVAINSGSIVGTISTIGGAQPNAGEYYTGDSGNVTVTSSTVTTINAYGKESLVTYGGAGGYVTATYSTIGNIFTYSGNSTDSNTAGIPSGGVIINHSTASNIYTYGGAGTGLVAISGTGGNVVTNNCTIGNIFAQGGNVYGISSTYANGGGQITVTSCTIDNIINSGGSGINAANTASISISDSTIGNITSNGGDTDTGIGSDGGDINITNSVIDIITSNGGNGYQSTVEALTGDAGQVYPNMRGGTITLTNSSANSISSVGGLSLYSGLAGHGGNIILISNSHNLSTFSINLSSGASTLLNNEEGYLTLRNSSMYNEFGRLDWSFATSNESDVGPIILNNSVNTVYAPGNISMYGLSGLGLSYPRIFKDAAICSDCYNFTNLTADPLIFNISTKGTYSLQEGSNARVTILSPADGNYSITQTEINFTATNASNCWYTINGGANIAHSCNTNITGLTALQGSIVWKVYANDSNGNSLSKTITIFVDSVVPTININGPANNNITNIRNQTFSANITDTNGIAGATIYIYNTTDLYNQSNFETSNPYTTVQWFLDGIYSWYISAVDTFGNIFDSITRTLTIIGPRPVITIISPAPQTYFINNVTFNISVTQADPDASLDSCWFTVDSGINNISLTNNSYGNYELVDYWMTDAVYRPKFYCNNSFGYQNSVVYTRRFAVDTIPPWINLNSPIDGYVLGSNLNVELNYTPQSTLGLQVCELWADWNGAWSMKATSNLIGANLDNYFYSNITSGDGTYTWNIYCMDHLGEDDWAKAGNETFVLDTTQPSISYLVPPTEISGVTVLRSNITVSVIADDLHYKNLSFSIFNSTGKVVTYNTTQKTLSATTTGLPDGTYYFNATAFDNLGHSNSTSTRTVIINTTVATDLIPPSINITNPYNGQRITSSGQLSVTLTVNASDANGLGVYWYSLDGSSNSTFTGPSITILLSQQDGTTVNHYIDAYVSDTQGNINTTRVNFVSIQTNAPGAGAISSGGGSSVISNLTNVTSQNQTNVTAVQECDLTTINGIQQCIKDAGAYVSPKNPSNGTTIFLVAIAIIFILLELNDFGIGSLFGIVHFQKAVTRRIQ